MDDDLRSAADNMDHETDRPAYAPKPALKPRRSFKMPLIILSAITLLAVAGLVLYKTVLNKPKQTTPTVVNPVVSETPKVVQDVPTSPLTEVYNSTALSVGFKYPKTWKVSEANGGIKVTSPEFSYTAAQLGTTLGNFRIYIRQGSRKIDGTYIGRGVAIKPSEKLTYTQPALGQRTDTLLSSFGFDSSDIFSFFLIAGNFQLNKNDTLGPDYGKEPDAYIVAGGYATDAAVDDLAFTSVPTANYATTKAYTQGLAIISSLQLK